MGRFGKEAIVVYFLKFTKMFGKSEKGERKHLRKNNMSKIRDMGGHYSVKLSSSVVVNRTRKAI